ncbi:MAG: hypothetical protein CMQ15_15505 [Gammaproteobacteria bacterium]|nr:hypothetical protein [Gammaproteobacteria bacterium]|tara:strand:+ start:1195 stop:1416 length:222 start_codon:yes stop_codon:yes gene_type:complete
MKFTFVVVAKGNIDIDPVVGVWSIDETRTLRNITDDVTNFFLYALEPMSTLTMEHFSIEIIKQGDDNTYTNSI